MELDTRRWWTLQGSCGDSCDITFQKYCDVTAPLSSLCICSYKWCFCQFDSQKGCIVLFCIYFILKTMLLYLLKMCFGFPPLWYLFLAFSCPWHPQCELAPASRAIGGGGDRGVHVASLAVGVLANPRGGESGPPMLPLLGIINTVNAGGY